MPVNFIPSAEAKKAKKTASQRRRNQNTEIGQLETLLPWKPQAHTTSTATTQLQGSTGGPIDKISVLRLTTTFMKFKDFWKHAVDYSSSGSPTLTADFDRLFSEAMDGFLLVISTNGEILFASESIKEFIGIFQPEVIGQSIYDITHEDDAKSIKHNLQPKGVRPNQFRQFYARFKSSISPGKKQLSKFGGHLMVQVSGNLKMYVPKGEVRPKPLGLIAECRLIESSSSILEVSIPQSSFTSTTNMDLKILSLDTKAHCLTGFMASQVKGSDFTDFFHPADNRKSIHCLKLLLITGEAVSPVLRFMTHTGEWIWVQLHGTTRYEADNKTPKYIEVTVKVVCSTQEGEVQMIEHKELYGRRDNLSDTNQSTIHADSRFAVPKQLCSDSPSAVVKSIESANVSPAVRDVLLHSRETTLSKLPQQLGRIAQWDDVCDAVVAYEVSKGLEPNYDSPYPQAPGETCSTYSISSTSSNSPFSFSASPDSSVSSQTPLLKGDSISPPPPINSPAVSSTTKLDEIILTHSPESLAPSSPSLSSLSPLSSVLCHSADGSPLSVSQPPTNPPSVSQPPLSWSNPPSVIQQPTSWGNPPSVSQLPTSWGNPPLVPPNSWGNPSPVQLPMSNYSSLSSGPTPVLTSQSYSTPAPFNQNSNYLSSATTTSHLQFPGQHQGHISVLNNQQQQIQVPVPDQQQIHIPSSTSHLSSANASLAHQPILNHQYGSSYQVNPGFGKNQQQSNCWQNYEPRQTGMSLGPGLNNGLGIETRSSPSTGYPAQPQIPYRVEGMFELTAAPQMNGMNMINDDDMIEILQQLM